MNHTEAILAEIARKGSSRDSIARLYREGIAHCDWGKEGYRVDWVKVNCAILDRYRPAGLDYIKAQAWKR